MEVLFAILLIGLALFSIVGTMAFVMREKRDHEAHTRYVRSPWPNEPVNTPASQKTDDESLSQSVTVPDPGDHVPVAEDATPDDTKAE